MLAAIAAGFFGMVLHSGRVPAVLSNLAIALLCWIGLAGSQWSITQAPDFSGLGIFFPNQVWQRILWPLGLVFLWSALLESIGRKLPDSTRLLLYAISFSLTIFASLPFAPIWEDLIPENAMWLLASLLASACNFHAIAMMFYNERSDSGKRWAMWILVANLGAIAGVMFSQIGSLGEWCVAAMIMTGVFAIAVSISGNSNWAKAIIPPMCLLSACLVANVRFNATEVKPWWIFVVLFFMPALIATTDLILEKRLKKSPRLAISGAIAIAMSVAVIAFVWSGTSPTEN